jgi:hypothetical protein
LTIGKWTTGDIWERVILSEMGAAACRNRYKDKTTYAIQAQAQAQLAEVQKP